MLESIATYRNKVKDELKDILSYWIANTVDISNGGFYGRLDNSNKVFAEAPKGSVLNSRILWAFSAAYSLTNDQAYLEIADRAFNYIRNHFIDKEFGGVYWTVDYRGKALDTKKQFYALSFAIYGLSEFVKSTGNVEAKELAIDLYENIIAHSYDKINGGYVEALSREWNELDDLRLSKKDANERKSMNTHLHILEGFANLYMIWPDEKLRIRITELIEIFFNHIIDKNGHHLILFFDDQWQQRSGIISYGHDIEAAWLLLEAAEIINVPELIQKVKDISVKIADAASEGLDKDGGLWYEYEPDSNHLVKEKHSWPQAEAMIGFFNAWQITGDEGYYKKSFASWNFVKDHIIDHANKEWFWGVIENYEIMNEDKVGIWKCPYHNTRACIELVKRIDKIVALNSNPGIK